MVVPRSGARGLDPGAGGSCDSLRALGDLRHQRVQSPGGGRTEAEKPLRTLGDYVRGPATVCDDALNMRAGRKPSLQDVERAEQLDEGGEGIDALARFAGGVGGAPVEDSTYLDLGGQRRPGPVVDAGMEHE